MAGAGSLDSDGLRSRVLRGVGWRLGSQGLEQLLRTVVVIILARLLSPHEYGIAGMVLVFMTFVIPFADLGLGAALVQRRRLSDVDISTVFWTGLAAGAVFTSLGVAVAGPLASFYREPEVRPLFAVFSVAFILTSLSAVHRSLLVREINFRSLELRMLTATVVSATVAIWAAAAGYGPWALIIQQLVANGLSGALYWTATGWRPKLAFSLASLRDLGGFGLKALGARVLHDLRYTTDRFLIGRFLGAPPLGLYTVAHNVALNPFNRIVTPLQDVLFPAFSRLQDDRSRVVSGWIRASRALTAVCAPVMLGLIVVAPEFVVVVLGAKWQDATRLLQILAWIGLLQALQGHVRSVVQACDRPGLLLRFSLLSLLLSIVAFFVGVPFGVIGVAVSLAVATTLLFPIGIRLATRLLGISLRGYVRSLLGVVQASAGMALIVAVVRILLGAAGLPAAARLVVLVPVGVVTYGALLVWRDRALIGELRALRSRTPAVPAAEPAAS